MSTGGTPSIAQDDDCRKVDRIERLSGGSITIVTVFNACRNSAMLPAATVTRQRRPCLRLPDAYVRTCRAAPLSTWSPLITGTRSFPVFPTEASPKSHGALMRRQIRAALHSCLILGAVVWPLNDRLNAQSLPLLRRGSNVSATAPGHRTLFRWLGFALIALEWFRGYREMHSKVTLVARHAYEIDQVDHFRKTHARLFFAGVVAFIAGMVLQLQLLGAWPGCCAFLGIIPQSLG